MKYYNVTLITRGKKETVLLKAENKKEALEKAKLKYGGLIIRALETSPPVEERFEEFKRYLMEQRKGKINREGLIAAIRQLAVMTNAGISLYDALMEVATQTNDAKLKQIFLDIANGINSGISFSEALKQYQNELGSLVITMATLGEKTGDMAHALFTLASILEQINENIKKFKKAVRYPIIVLSAMAIAFVIVISYVVPKFKSIFDKFHAELPLPTKILLGLEHLFNTYGLYVVGALLIGIFLIRFFYRTNKQFKYATDKFLLKVYLIKDIVFYSQIHRFMLVFSELVRAGIPVVDALDNSVTLVDNAIIKERLQIIKNLVQKGASISDAFKDTGLFENMLIQMISAGEKSGQLESMLQKVTEYYEMKFNHILDNLSAYIEPILLSILAALVLLLALGIFLPMWDMAKAINK
ncbi:MULTISPECIES: type II secretion system F family protein [unclassified Nitratiruptor]|uniref:type II secretion system F family protein n=1 Tax=unclassified Nitratiruptor TaxID=2624044 RepID=UPI0019152D31|nr:MULTISPECIES: type II secretion system F family protein [unclassified Nitratiruptor]BCD60274.1 general secretion pathway protein F [Nitratiruptor sp. YY08-10]BCD64237.1 general secretion pathway protein F [Nitratiruptor sp. YY08-14]